MPCAVTEHRLPQTGGSHASRTRSCVTHLAWSILPVSCHTSPSMVLRMTCLPGCAKYCVRLIAPPVWRGSHRPSLHNEHNLADVAVVFHVLMGGSRFGQWERGVNNRAYMPLGQQRQPAFPEALRDGDFAFQGLATHHRANDVQALTQDQA